MATHAQNATPAQIIEAAAAIIKADTPLDERQRQQAAGYAAQQAVDNGETEPLDLIILIGNGDYKAALHLLVNMSFEDDTQVAQSTVFGNMINSTTTSGQAPAPKPQPDPATTPSRRGQRPVGKKN